MQRKIISCFGLFVMVFALNIVTVIVAQNTNLDECIVEFDLNQDYFPDKVSFDHAENVSVVYERSFKVVTVVDAMGTEHKYILLQCGAPVPDMPDNAQLVEIPITRTIALATTQLPHLDIAEALDTLVGIDSFLYTNTLGVRQRIETGDVIEVAPNFQLSLELVLVLEPDVVFTDDFNAERLSSLSENDIRYALNTDYLESTPLGRAEWLKYTALFFNTEALANDFFETVETEYRSFIDLLEGISSNERPLVLWNTVFGDSWFLPGTQTYVGLITADAGGDLVLADSAIFSTPFAFEAVYDAGQSAGVWITNAFAVGTLADLLAQDERYVDFAPVINGNVWNTNADENENFGNNFYELGVVRPDMVLADLIAVFYPTLLPNHEFAFLRRLE